MIIQFSKNFEKQLIKQNLKVRNSLNERLVLFTINQNDPILHNHALKGKYREYKSINITGDVRALYKEINGNIIVFALIGTHSQLYK